MGRKREQRVKRSFLSPPKQNTSHHSSSTQVLNEEYARVVEAQLMAEARTAREQRVAARARALVAAGVVEEGPAARAEAWRRVEEEEGAVARREGDPVLDDGRRIQVGGLGGGG